MHWTSVAGLIFCTVVWGAGFSAIKTGLQYLPPFLFVGLRFLATSLLVAVAMRRRGAAFAVSRDHWREMVALVLLFYGQQALLFIGMQHTHAGRAGVILNSQPLMTALLAHFLIGRDRLSLPKLLGIALGFAGVAVVFGDRLGRLSPAALRGDALILVAALGWAVGTIITKRLEGKVSASTIVLWCAAGSSVLFLATSALRHESVLRAPDARFWVAVTYLVVIATACSYVLWNRLIQINLPSLATSFCFLTPVSSVFFGWLILREPLTSGMVLGTGLVAAGIVLANVFGANGDGVKTRLARVQRGEACRPN